MALGGHYSSVIPSLIESVCIVVFVCDEVVHVANDYLSHIFRAPFISAMRVEILLEVRREKSSGAHGSGYGATQ